MILYNSKLFAEDPLNKFHLEEFHSDNNIVIHLGYNEQNLIKHDGQKHILIDLGKRNHWLSKYFTINRKFSIF